MKRADRTEARYTLVLGGNEVKSGDAQLKPMAGGAPVPVRLDALAPELKRLTSG
jgi:histidyl-tRNA synthetase